MTDSGADWIKLMIAMATVLALLAGLAAILKYVAMRGGVLSFKSILPKPSAKRRLWVEESLPIDARRRLVIIRCDDREHLLLLSPERDIVIEPSIHQPPTQTPDDQTD